MALMVVIGQKMEVINFIDLQALCKIHRLKLVASQREGQNPLVWIMKEGRKGPPQKISMLTTQAPPNLYLLKQTNSTNPLYPGQRKNKENLNILKLNLITNYLYNQFSFLNI
jgi:hypothetical protein